MADIRWKASSRATNPLVILGNAAPPDGLNGLAATTGAALSAAIENVSTLDLNVDLELVVSFGVAPVADNVVEVWFVRSVDGTNYEDGSTATILPRSGFVGNFVLRAVTAVQRMVIPRVVVPPRDFKVLVINRATQAFAASGNTLTGYFYRGQV